jgi:hypothetical protein
MTSLETTFPADPNNLNSATLEYAEVVMAGKVGQACQMTASLLEQPVGHINTDANPLPVIPGKQVDVHTTARLNDPMLAKYDSTSPEYVRAAANSYAELRVGTGGDLTEAAAMGDLPVGTTPGCYERAVGAFQAFTASRHVGRAVVTSDGHFAAGTALGHLVYGSGRTPRYVEPLTAYLRKNGFQSAHRADVLFPFELVTPHVTDLSLSLPDRLSQAIQYGRIDEACRVQAALLELAPLDVATLPATDSTRASNSDNAALAMHWWGNSNYGGSEARQYAAQEVGIGLESLRMDPDMPLTAADELRALTIFTLYYSRLHAQRAELVTCQLGRFAISDRYRQVIVYTADGDAVIARCDPDEMRQYLVARNYREFVAERPAMVDPAS